jgi:hypothetical protein
VFIDRTCGKAADKIIVKRGGDPAGDLLARQNVLAREKLLTV